VSIRKACARSASAYRRGMDRASFEAEVDAAFRGRGRFPLREAVADTARAP